jgi:pimeloyl-ACP methyl ester carboxylesterase
MYTNINDHRINYELMNQPLLDLQKPVLVFLHEGLGSIGQWKDFPQNLCDKVNLPGLIYDRYGYGLSNPLQEKRKSTFLHDEAFVYLPQLIKNLKIKNKLILIGHSDGASIALIYASAFSETLLGVISEAAHVLLENISLDGIKKIDLEYKSNEPLRKRFEKYHPDISDTMFNGWVDAWLDPEFKAWNIEELLPEIKVPVLAIQGDTDEYGSYDQLASIKKNVSADVEILYLPDCGHVPHLQATEKVVSKMADFIFKIV